MELTNQYKSGLLKLAALLGLLCFFIVFSHWWPRSESLFVLDKQAQCFIENQELILAEAKPKSSYTYYVNSITDYSGYQLGLSVAEIDRLLAYRQTGKKVYSLSQFKSITEIDSLKLEGLKYKLVFPKQKKVLKRQLVNTEGDFKKKSLQSTWDINVVTSAHIHSKCNLSWEISNRIVNYRNSIKKYTSMKQLNKVYGISESDLTCLKSQYKIE